MLGCARVCWDICLECFKKTKSRFPFICQDRFFLSVIFVFFSGVFPEVFRGWFFLILGGFWGRWGAHFWCIFGKGVGFSRKGVDLDFVTPYSVFKVFSWFGLLRNALNMKKTASGNLCFFGVRK